MKRKNSGTKEANRKRVAAALMELLKTDLPDALEEKLTDFLNEAMSGSIIGRFTQVPGGLQALEHLLAFAEWEEANPNWGQNVTDIKEASHAAN